MCNRLRGDPCCERQSELSRNGGLTYEGEPNCCRRQSQIAPTLTTNSKRKGVRSRCQRYPDCCTNRQPCGPPCCQSDNWEDARDPFNLSATGYLGTHRASMLENELLARADVGKPKCRYPNNRPLDFTYGHVNYPSPLSAGHALVGWQTYYCDDLSLSKKKKSQTDFLALNRAAITSGICRVKELRDYRNTHQLLLKDDRDHKSSKTLKKPKISQDYVYGKPNVYYSTAGEIMSFNDHRQWIRCVKAGQREPCMDLPTMAQLGRKENHAYQLRAAVNAPKVEAGPLWHMPKFERNAKPHLSTFRNDKSLVAAHNANSYERVGREGVFGEGVTTRARTHTEAVKCVKY